MFAFGSAGEGCAVPNEVPDLVQRGAVQQFVPACEGIGEFHQIQQGKMAAHVGERRFRAEAFDGSHFNHRAEGGDV